VLERARTEENGLPKEGDGSLHVTPMNTKALIARFVGEGVAEVGLDAPVLGKPPGDVSPNPSTRSIEWRNGLHSRAYRPPFGLPLLWSRCILGLCRLETKNGKKTSPDE
jgi:hypothetical protein